MSQTSCEIYLSDVDISAQKDKPCWQYMMKYQNCLKVYSFSASLSECQRNECVCLLLRPFETCNLKIPNLMTFRCFEVDVLNLLLEQLNYASSVSFMLNNVNVIT